ncbi:hypothetical protein [Devosia naphthalenivorans]|uniref:hypothetical protein n=1 Tax=Devosia naphthalenivorans TaxID=2082392 RepID=UPI0013B05B9A|nr:hypothetical protein [Devosia naphthalenivorans]
MFELMATKEFWTPVLTSTAFLGVVGAILSPWYRGTIERSIQHKFDRQIEDLRASFRREEEHLKAELSAQESALNALRAGALSQLSARRTSLDNRKLEAVEKLWAAVISMGPARAAVEITSRLRMEKLLNPSSMHAEGESVTRMGEMLWKMVGADKLTDGGLPKGDLERPFVSPLTWALFSAYTLAVMYPIAQIMALKSGLDGKSLNNSEVVLKPIREALPELAGFIDEFGLSGIKVMVDELEKKLLSQMRLDLDGNGHDGQTVERAAKILQAADAAAQSLKPTPDIPDSYRAEKLNVSP